MWDDILSLKRKIYQTNNNEKSLIQKVEDLLNENKLQEASNSLIELEISMQNIKDMYKKYKKNII